MMNERHQLSVSHDQLLSECVLDAPFGVALSLHADTACVWLFGEIDFTCVERLHDLLDQLRRDGYRHIVLEVSRLQLLSASGAGALAHAAHEYAQASGSLLMSQPTRMVTRVLELNGLRHLIVRSQHRVAALTQAPAFRSAHASMAGAPYRPRPPSWPSFWVMDSTQQPPVAVPRVGAEQVSAALAGVAYPARRWQLLAQAAYYGADVGIQVELARLPERLYAAAVIAAVVSSLAARQPASGSPRR